MSSVDCTFKVKISWKVHLLWLLDQVLNFEKNISAKERTEFLSSKEMQKSQRISKMTVNMIKSEQRVQENCSFCSLTFSA